MTGYTTADTAVAALLRIAADHLEDPTIGSGEPTFCDLVAHITREVRRFTEDLGPAVEADPSIDMDALTAAWLAKVSEVSS